MQSARQPCAEAFIHIVGAVAPRPLVVDESPVGANDLGCFTYSELVTWMCPHSLSGLVSAESDSMSTM